MPRTPRYSKHKATGQAYATINGRVVYFGAYGTSESRNAYDQAIADWRELNAAPAATTTVGQLTVMYLKQHAQDYYSPGEVRNYRPVLRVLVKMFRTTKVGEFGPKKLKAVQDELAKTRVRNQVNICKPTQILYVGDYDPSGLSINEDIQTKLRRYAPKAVIYFDRIAVTEQQIEEYHLLSRPPKSGDSRAKNFSGGCVETEAIEPAELKQIIRDNIEGYIDEETLQKTQQVETMERETLQAFIGVLPIF
ncbi:hypothetical protein KOR42_21320 [Thalassoglobus neptunius]|uniref:Uncharacterized protein n=1 Tax=Thalassoglobus neptunius TaxID=1938619 RepID=A0A5C5X6T1_9PLAN|nr:hypothetical protein [Thalassoglobus neptunius]TWT58746.1 hypothetical protein KOR42_21320 [Thalassoglobus neptunius]